jgi:hypothetical protein
MGHKLALAICYFLANMCTHTQLMDPRWFGALHLVKDGGDATQRTHLTF